MPNMDWQLGLVLVAVGVAAAYLGRATWRSWRGGQGACGGCSCRKAGTTPASAPEQTLISTEEVTRRLRNGGPG